MRTTTGRPPMARRGRQGIASRRVVRGGSWGYFPVDPRSAYRYGDLTVDRNYNLGFRVARTLLQGVR